MSWGRENRLSRIINPTTARTNMLAVDHGYFLGPTHGLEQPRERLAPLLPYADALMATRGLVRATMPTSMPCALVLRVSGGSSVVGPTLTDEHVLTSIEDALRINAAAVAVSVFVGTEHESQTLRNLSTLVDRAQQYHLPVLAVTAVGKELGQQDLRHLSLATRICAELGADIVKTYYADGFESLVASAMVPVVIAGGKKLDATADALQLAFDAVAAGAAGIDFGRNCWQSEHPAAMARALRGIVHEGLDVAGALDLHSDIVRGRDAVPVGAG